MNPSKKLYLIAIKLPEDLNRKILFIKKEIARDFLSKHSLRLPAHITLQKPFHYVNEIFLIDRLGAFKTNLPRFELKLKGFGAFIPRVIYVAVDESRHLVHLHQQLGKWLLSEMEFEQNLVNLTSFTPHVTVAYRDLTRQNFTAAWKRYGNQDFSAGFVLKENDLWRHNGKQWEVIHKFDPFR